MKGTATKSRLADDRGPRRPESLVVVAARTGIALAHVASGDLDGAEREAKETLKNATLPHQQGAILGVMALVALHRHQPADALTLAERGLDAFSSGHKWPSSESYLHLTRAEALHALGRTQDAHATLREAKGRIVGIAATLDDPELRESYLNNVDANARTLKLAREWLGEDAGTA